MKAIILAAGRGERMRPLTDKIPKALLEVRGKALIVWHVEKLARAGATRIVINHAHLGEQIEAALGDGARFGVEIVYSREAQALETAGGIAYALDALDSSCFAAVNADVYSDYDYARLASSLAALPTSGALAHLVMVDNPAHHAQGDFALQGEQVTAGGRLLTFSGLAAYHRDMFVRLPRGVPTKLAPLLREQIALRRVSGEHYRGRWRDVGTPARLAAINAELA